MVALKEMGGAGTASHINLWSDSDMSDAGAPDLVLNGDLWGTSSLLVSRRRRDFSGSNGHSWVTLTRLVSTAQVDQALRQEFERLSKEWLDETGAISTIAARVMHPTYQRIIGMGPRVIPCILDSLMSAPNHWFWALSAITGESPLPVGAEGDIERMRRAWLAWGARRGLVRNAETLRIDLP